jgi:hypothetical protein
MVMEDKCLLIFFEQVLSCFEHQKHDLALQFHRKYILNSKYLIFDYKAFIDKFKEINNMEFL